MTALSPVRRREILQSLRQGTVPDGNLDVLAVGIDLFATTIDEDLDAVASGGAIFKAVRGEYGSGKTFFSRWVEQRAMQRGLAVAEVQISELETPLHKLETVYRRTIEELRTSAFAKSAFRNVIDAWLYGIEEDAATAAGADEATAEQIAALLEQRLASVATATPVYPMVLRAYRDAVDRDDAATADALIAWLGGQPHVGAAAKRVAGVRQDVDHFLAMGFLQGLLAVLKGARHPGLVLVIDEVETLQRMRSDSRAKALNALRQWIDELDSGRYPGLYLIITGTPAFYDGRLGVQALPPLAQRLQTDFGTDARFDNPRAPQIRLTGSILIASSKSASAFVTSTPMDRLSRTESARWSATLTCATLPMLLPASSVGKSGYPHASSSRSLSRTYWTESINSPTLIHANTIH